MLRVAFIKSVHRIAQENLLHSRPTVTIITSSPLTMLQHDPHPAFTCSKLTIETLEQGVKYVQS